MSSLSQLAVAGAAVVAAATLLAGSVSQNPAESSPILRRLDGWIERFQGEIGIAAKNLDTEETLAVHGDTRFPTASLIKVAVMAEVFGQIADGKLRPNSVIALRDEDKAGDETVPLNLLHDGAQLTVSDFST